MLVLSRKEGETLHIGDDCVLTIARVSGNRVSIAIDAPRSVRVVRSELLPLNANQSQSPTRTEAATR